MVGISASYRKMDQKCEVVMNEMDGDREVDLIVVGGREDDDDDQFFSFEQSGIVDHDQGRPRDKFDETSGLDNLSLLRTTLYVQLDMQETHNKDQEATKIISGSDNPTLGAGPDYNDDDDVDEDGFVEFMKIEPPMEPPEDDQPTKCPAMPEFSFIYEKGFRKESPIKYPFVEKPRKSAEPSPLNKAYIKRNSSVGHHPANSPLPYRGQQNNIFDLFQQCKEFGFA